MSGQELPTSLPTPRLIDPSSVPSLRWGIMGPGGIADTWVSTVLANTSQQVVAAGSTSAERASAFAEKHGIPRSYGSYDDLLADTEIDIIYIATRQHTHCENVLQALAAGKHVLVEKPMATIPEDARTIRDAARASGLFVMEAMWTTYLPQSDIIRQLVADDVLGDIRLVQADFGLDLRDVDRLFDINGGGVSHDVGIYPTAFVSSFLGGTPLTVSAVGDVTENGVDSEIVIRTSYANGANGYASSSMRSFSHTIAWVDGTHASLEVGRPFFIPSSLTLFDRSLNPTPVAQWRDETGITEHRGLFYQAVAVAKFIADGLTESPWRNLDASVLDIETIAAARHQLGVYYPGESR
jgi:predicted dehydrogenase